MDDSSNSTPPTFKVKVTEADPLTAGEGPVVADTLEQVPQKSSRPIRTDWLQFGLLGLLAVILVGAAVWWLAARQGVGGSGVGAS